MGDVKETVVVVLVVVQIARKIDMVDPDVVRCLNANGITNVRKDLRDLDVADDDVGLLKDTETNAVES